MELRYGTNPHQARRAWRRSGQATADPRAERGAVVHQPSTLERWELSRTPGWAWSQHVHAGAGSPTDRRRATVSSGRRCLPAGARRRPEVVVRRSGRGVGAGRRRARRGLAGRGLRRDHRARLRTGNGRGAGGEEVGRVSRARGRSVLRPPAEEARDVFGTRLVQERDTLLLHAGAARRCAGGGRSTTCSWE